MFYRAEICFDGAEDDRMSSHPGLRETRIEGNRMFFNGVLHYIEMVLGRGFFPDYIYIASFDLGTSDRHRVVTGSGLWHPAAAEGV